MAPCVSSCCSSRGNYCCARQWLNRDLPRGKGGFNPYPKEAGLGFSWFGDGFWVARMACSHCQIWPLQQRTSPCPYFQGAFGWADRVPNESTANLNTAAVFLILSEARAWGVWGGLCSVNQLACPGGWLPSWADSPRHLLGNRLAKRRRTVPSRSWPIARTVLDTRSLDLQGMGLCEHPPHETSA